MTESPRSFLKETTMRTKSRITIVHQMAGCEYVYAVVTSMEEAAYIVDNANIATGYLEIRTEGRS